MRNFTGSSIPISVIKEQKGIKAVRGFLNVLLLLICYGHAMAVSTPTCPIISGNFSGIADGTTSSNTAIGWTLDASGVPSSRVYFAVKSNRVHAEDLGGVGIWRTNVYSTSGYASFQVAVKVHSEGDMNSTEYAEIFYKINGGSEILLEKRTGNFGTIDFISPELTGNNVQLIVKLYNYNNGGSQTSKYHIEEYRVFKEAGPCAGSSISVSASTNRTQLTCANPSATLTASSTASGVTYAWTGPNSFTSTAQSPVVSAAGTYTVTGTSASGTGTASVTLTESKSGPGVTASGGSLACSSSVVLSASSSTSGVTYAWTSPTGFTSTLQNPTVSTAGTYTVTVTNPANGCTSQQTVTVSTSGVTGSFWLEDFTFANGTTSDAGSTSWSIQNTGAGTFSIQNNEFRVNGIGTGTAEGVWTSGTIDISGKTDVSVSAGIRSGVSSGGALENSGSSLDYIRVYYKLNGGSEVLVSENLGTINSNSSTNTTVSAASLNGTSLQIVIRARTTTSDEFYYFDNVTASGTSQGVTAFASVNGTLSCSTTSVPLSGSTNATGAVTYSWTGPNGFTSSAQNPSVSAGGTYTLTVANSSGCSGTATVTVSQNTTAPGATASVSGSLSCGSSVTLNGSSGTSGVSYRWTGPGSFVSTSQNPSVSNAGTYTLTVTNPANGCTSTQNAEVTSAATTSTLWLEEFTLSNGTTSDTGTTSWSVTNTSGGTFSVNTNEFKVSGIGTSTQGVWTSGSIDITNKANVTLSVNIRSSGVAMNTTGTYLDYLRIYYKLNGGAEVLFSEQIGNVNNHSTTPTTVSIGSLSGTSVQIIVKARASGTDEFYYFDNVKVAGTSISSSFTVAIPAPGALTCSTPSRTLTANGSVSGLSYSWTGPNGFSSVQQNPVVSAAGTYMVTASLGGCAATASVVVSENKTAPQLTAAGGTLTCTTSVALAASSTVSGVTYAWTGPGGFTSTQSSPTVSTPGTYTVTITNPANGCTNSQSVTVTTSSGSGTATDFWVEDFTFANGTTVDTGTTSWSLQNASGTCSVQSNEFKYSNPSGTESVWLSGVVDISAKSDVIISALLKSGTTSTNDYLEEDDYISVYYKLNGGAEVMAYRNYGGMNDNNNTAQSYTYTSATPLNGSTLQVIIRVRNSNATEIYYFDNVKLNGKPSPLGVITTSVSGAISCTNASVQLSASSTASGATYYWVRPDGSTISQQNPTVNVAGNYVVVVSANGCQATQTVTVSGSTTPPDVSIAGNNFNCSGGASTVTLTAQSSVSGLNYAWTGPGTITGANTATAVVSAAGTHTVTVTNPANACTSTATFTVGYTDGTTTAVWNETFDELSDGTTSENGATAWSVDNSKIHTVSLSAYSDETGTPYYQEVRGGNLTVKTTRGEVVWTSQSISIAAHGQVQLMVDVAGEGSLNDETDCGDDCFDYDYVKIYYKLNGGPEIPFTTNGNFPGKLALAGLTSSTGILSGSTVQIIIRSYNTGNNEMFHFDNIRVLKIVQSGSGTVAASASGTISCTNPTATLSATPVVAGATYSWAGPGGTTFTGASVNVSAGGTYNLTVSGGGGCLTGATTSVAVAEDKAAPVVVVTTPDVLTCTRTSLTLTAASSPSSGVTYLWTRPDGSTLSSTGLTVTTPGNYSVKVTNTANGCFTVTPVTVFQNNTPPEVTASVSSSLTCTVTSVNLVSSSPAPGATYQWSGPGTITNSTSATASVSTAGTYTVTVTDPSTGCITAKDVTVGQNNTPPGASASASNNGVITCTVSTISLTATTGATGVTYQWSGGTGTITNPTQATASVTTAGTYTVTVTNTASNCQSTAQVVVTENKTLPGASASASNNGVINCSVSAISLTGTSGTSGVTYQWSGGTGTITNANQATASVTTAGTYTVTVTNPVNNCQSTAQVVVTENRTLPGASASASNSGVINCTVSTISLTATSGTSGVTYQWSGGTGTITNANQATASVTTPGTYTVTVTNPANNCQSTAQVVVTENRTLPGASASASNAGKITCTVSTISLTATSGTSGVTYQWSGGTGTITNPTQATASVTTPGTYTVTVTNPANNCQSTAQVVVTENKTLPGASASASNAGKITCTVSTISLTATSGTSGVTYQWSGGTGTITNPTQATASVTTAGTYTVTVTNPANNCQSTAQVEVTENKTLPGASASASNAGKITCTVSTISLTATSGTSGVTYQWSGGTGTITNPTQATASVTTPGTYTVTVTNPANNCQSTAQVEVTENKTLPGASASASNAGKITCTVSTISLTATSGTSGVTYQWSGGTGTITNANQATASVTTAGTYTVTVTNPANNCQSTAQVEVTENKTLPGASASASNAGKITCTVSTISLTATSGTSGVTYQWSGGTGTITNPTQATASVTTPGTYTVTVTNPVNNCQSTAQVVVTEDKTLPGASASVTGTFTCTNNTVTLNGASGTSGVTYQWSGNSQSFTPGPQKPTTVHGTYTVVVTNPANNCVSSASVTTVENKTQPGVTTAISPIVTCSQPLAMLGGSSQTANVLFAWTGPSNFISNEANPGTSIPGTYNVVATDQANGCTSQASTTVGENKVVPQNVTATRSVPVDLTCTNNLVTLNGASTTSNVSYAWTGPDNFTSTSQHPAVDKPGIYRLTVTNGANGCTETADVTVEEHKELPEGVTAVASNNIDCARPSTTITGGPATGVTYSWSGPSNFTSTQSSFTTTVPGTYTLTVTNSVSGCSALPVSVTVTESKTPPIISVTTPDGLSLTCFISPVRLNGNSNIAGSTFRWTGPPGFDVNTQNISVTAPSDYLLTVTAPNGCTATRTTRVGQTQIVPTASAAVSNAISCANPAVTLNGGTSAGPVTYTWTGPSITPANANQEDPGNITIAGVYSLTIVTAAGCSDTKSVTVTEDSRKPEAVTAGYSGNIDCDGFVILESNSTTAGANYRWEGPGGFESNEPETVTGTPGTYKLTVSHPDSGCVVEKFVVVIEEGC